MPTQFKDYYRILQVDPSAEPEVVTAAYKRLAHKYHPDTNKSPDAHRRMQEINAAYEILGNPENRAKYDRERASHSSSFEEDRHRRAEHDRQQQEQREAAQRRAEYERKQQEKAKPEKQVEVANTNTRRLLVALPLLMLVIIGMLIIVQDNSMPFEPSPTEAVKPISTFPTFLSSETPTLVAQSSSARSMTMARALHTATVLHDGRVLIVGGYTALDVDTASAEIFDPTTNAFSPTGSLNTARHGHSATLLPDGRVLVIAGYHNGWLSSAEIYDPATGQWSITQPIFAHGTDHTATLLKDGRVLVMAGSPQSGGSPTPDDRVEIFDPTTNRWQRAALHQNTYGSHIATLLTDGRVLIAGGLADPAIYDPASDTWQPAGRLAVSRWSAQAVQLQDGRVLLIGGRAPFEEERTIDSVEIYEPVGNTWRQAAPLAQARYLHTTTLLPDGRVLVTGGGRLLDNSWHDPEAILGSVEIYDPASDTWSALPPLQQVRADHTATLLPDGRVFVADGFATGYTILDSVEILKLDGR